MIAPRFYILSILFLSLFLSACGRDPGVTVSLTGSSTIAPLASDIGRAYEEMHPGVRVDVQTGGSSRGIADVRRGLADIGMTSRSLTPDESDLDPIVLARDGLCVIVHRDNDIAELTSEQIVAIFTGKVETWSELGGSDTPITVVSKASGRATLEVFLEFFDLDECDIEADVIIGDNQQGILSVAGDPHAVAYVSIGAARFEAERGTAIRLLPLHGVAPEPENVDKGIYPLSRKLLWVTYGERSQAVNDLIAFARSASAHPIIERHGFIPVTE